MDTIGNAQNTSPTDGWASCRQPFKGLLERLAANWINGTMTREQVAYELWVAVHMGLTPGSCDGHTGATGIQPRDVRSQIELLAGALVESGLTNVDTSETRMHILNDCVQRNLNHLLP